MKTYIVEIPEVHYSIRCVKANSEEEALELAEDADDFDLEYSHTLDKDKWKVNEQKD